MSIESIQDVHHLLKAIPQFKDRGKAAADFSLDRFQKFCAAMGDPQDSFPAIHVGGSNGKGSTCQILASVYQQAGNNVGVYTSPHVLAFSERFTINGNQISDEELVHFFSSYQPLIKSFRLTYFEVSTAIAFWWFARRKVDIAIIEVGLGGRLDATNIITPLVSVITNVTMDHTDILGDTIPAIAREKAGIIKEKVPVVIGNMPAEAAQEIEHAADKNHCEFRTIDALQPQFKDEIYLLETEEGSWSLVSDLETPVQAYNIAVGWRVTQLLQSRFPVSKKQFEAGIGHIRTLYPNRGRFEKLDSHYRWYFDGAHNLDAVRAMKQMVDTIQPVAETVLILSLMQDKINEKMMIEFSEFKKIVYHTLPLGRAATMNDIKTWLPDVQSFPDKQNIPSTLLKEFRSELVIFAGSFYFYATVRDWLSMLENR
ncbi:MAG: bifunctional folylpolyglutamate synthase/dihydrofolate synthase [Balneolaceae bacterium]|nr:bifunctional folylpolyglutamate synthase/dihydrofolate synthase [Balneolaceae bacterium]